MNSSAFLEEVLNSGKCPAGFEKMYLDFQKFQAHAYDALKELGRVCRLNDIPYQLVYGTLIGAVRDHGQVPWDYDIDVFVPYEFRKKLIKALEEDLQQGFYFDSYEKDHRYPHVFTRLAPKGYDSERLHVDIFYTIGVPDEESSIQAFSDQVAELAISYFYRAINVFHYSNGNVGAAVKLLWQKIKRLNRNSDDIYAEYINLCDKYSGRDCKYCIAADQFGRKRYYSTSELWDLVETSLGEDRFYITSNYDKILKAIYGDYTKTPSLQSRINEMMRGYRGLISSRMK